MTATVIHNSIVPIHTILNGRARYRIKHLKFNKQLKLFLEKNLKHKSEFTYVEANTTSTSLLIHFLPHLSLTFVQEEIAKITELFYSGDFNSTTSEAQVDVHHNDQSTLSTETPSNWHILEANHVVLNLQTSLKAGLSHSQALNRLHEYGPNLLKEMSKRSGVEIFCAQLKTLPVALLSVSAGISLVTGGVVAAGVILSVVFANAYIGYSMELSSERIISQLANMGPTETLVIRNSKIEKINIAQIVIGDVIVLSAGSYIPADARIISNENLTVDESALTGESILVIKRSDSLSKLHIPIGDRINMVYRGTIVMGGSGLAVVIATGEQTEIGKIQNLVAATKPSETPLQKQMDRLSNQLVSLSGAVGGLIFVAGMLHGYGFLQMLNVSISLIVAAVPEGLPTVATTTLTQSTRKMRLKNVIVRKIDAIETLGCIEILCLDKTGTLTMNEMAAVSVFSGMCAYYIENNLIYQADSTHHIADTSPTISLFKMMQIAFLCNEGGSPTENALLAMVKGANIDTNQLRRQYPLLHTEYRTSTQSYMVTHHQSTFEKKIFSAIKGNPTQVLDLCRFYLINGEKKLLTKKSRDIILSENTKMGSEGLRVLGMAYAEHDDASQPLNNLVFTGLVGLMDNPRPGVKEFIQTAHKASVKTVMITGDQAITAAAIAKKLGIAGSETLRVFDATTIDTLDAEQLKNIATETHVFARVSPANKLQIVQALKASGKIVGMAGDGINDAPALKMADVGIAMGKNGTEVAREVASVVLLDDNLHNLIDAIQLGRATYDSIKKSVRYLLTTNISETFLMLGAVTIGLGQPLNPQHLLWINLVTDVLPALALAMDPPDSDVLLRAPRKGDEEIISNKDYKHIMVESTAMTATTFAPYLYAISRYGVGMQAQSMAFMTLTLSQLLHTFSAQSKNRIFDTKKSTKNKYIVPAVGIGLGLQFLAFVFPGFRRILGVSALGPIDLMICATAAGVNFTFDEAIKKRSHSHLLPNLS